MARITKAERLINERVAELEDELKVLAGLRARLAAQPKRVRGTKRAVVAASLNKQVDAA